MWMWKCQGKSYYQRSVQKIRKWVWVVKDDYIIVTRSELSMTVKSPILWCWLRPHVLCRLSKLVIRLILISGVNFCWAPLDQTTIRSRLYKIRRTGSIHFKVTMPSAPMKAFEFLLNLRLSVRAVVP